MTRGRALITGAARGIGAAIADLYRARGYDVVAPSRAELDLSHTAGVAGWIEGNKDLDVDVLINCAGENKVNGILSIELPDWERVLAVNLTAAFLLTQAVGRFMAQRGTGWIVNVGSAYAFLGRAGRAAYAASKSGLIGLTRTAALELGQHGVLVNAVCPGFVETDMTRRNNTPDQVRALAEQTALKRLARPEEIAGLVLWLGSASNTYLTGQAVIIDGGFSIQ